MAAAPRTSDPTPPAGAPGGLFLGLISGTSVDGIDAALVAFEPSPRIVFARTYPYPADLQADVLRWSQASAQLALDDIGRLDTRLGRMFAAVARQALDDAGVAAADVRAIGSHGQTLRHDPRGESPFTQQLGDASVIAETTGITTVADFRRRDVAAGGQGAPLMPAFHAAVLSSPGEDRAVLNLGGIANLTLLPRQGPVRGFDTGPANGLMDAWCLRHRGERYDRGGAFARAGRVDAALLARLLDEPWFAMPPPKSTGRDQFQLDWVAARLRDESPADVQATLCELSAVTVADALRAQAADCRRLLVCGGGVHNPLLMARLADHLPGVAVESTAALGLDPDFIEAAGFAWLARETLAGRPGNLPAVTGARGARVLGAIHPA
ncbi:MAG TPA: anhydro-N-acetylmuramic acid kinase [Arenimonas sp.]|uniref:anhydro-N-acetylmuramic acid kinase n=1 Tax=Arenimonas sp. TaxID=1872635 RepID=UPI002D7E353C|nr:anhydro-N-acetylmuramic acid kinase [Arenimonas sp.]HEU0153207.1 anhydro-N-acetylmuramic acid kinase [Arenimonas sp.]